MYNVFTMSHDEQTITILKALADPTRLEIIRQLVCDSKFTPCKKVLEQSLLSQPTVSHHIGKLVEAGVVLEHKAGKEKIYQLNKSLLAQHGFDPKKL